MSILDLFSHKPAVLRLRFRNSPSSNPLVSTAEAETIKVQQSLIEAQRTEINQLKFLLASAPMIDAPNERIRYACGVSPFAYIHPKTIAKYAMSAVPQSVWLKFPGSPTKWILTSLMPEDRVIYSPLPMPGLEKRLLESK